MSSRKDSARTIQTVRLIGRPLSDGDAAELFRMHADPSVMATLGGVKTEEEARRWLDDNLKHWEEYGFGLWTFCGTDDEELIGRCGFRRVEVGGNSEIELGYAVIAARWGMGFAAEMASAILSNEFERVGVDTVVALIHATNRASRRVADKLGFRFDRNVTWRSAPAMMYRLRPGRSNPPKIYPIA